MTTPLVSILMPCYNAAPWLSESLESAIGQTWQNKEIILVNDGSTDGSGDIARSYAARGVRVIDQENRGPSAALNRALSEARGDFVKFFDSDDLLSPESLSIKVDALKDRPGCIAMGEWGRFTHEPSEATFHHRFDWHGGDPLDWIVETWGTGGAMTLNGQFLIPMDILRTHGGWDERLTLINDFEFYGRMILSSREIIFTPGSRIYYRTAVPGCLSRKRTPKAWKSAFLSVTLGVGHMLAREDSARTRAAAANVFQSLAYMMFPDEPKLITALETRVRELGGSTLKPSMGGRRAIIAKLIGWRLARSIPWPFNSMKK